MVVGATLESLEVSLGLAVAGVFEGVSWNLRALAERKEPIVVPQLVLVLGGLKLVSEGDTNKSELVLAKENGREVFYPTPQVLLYYNPLPPSQLLTHQRRRACPWHFILRVDVVVMRGSALNPSSFHSFDCFKESTVVVRATASLADASCCSSYSSWMPSCRYKRPRKVFRCRDMEEG